MTEKLEPLLTRLASVGQISDGKNGPQSINEYIHIGIEETAQMRMRRWVSHFVAPTIVERALTVGANKRRQHDNTRPSKVGTSIVLQVIR